MRTQVAIIGAGPAGMLLSHLLAADSVDSVIVEARTEDYVLARIRAGILEHASVELLRSVGLGDRLAQNGIEHRGIYLQTPGDRHHLDFVDLVGRNVWVYGQTEVQRDLVAARHAGGQTIVYGADDVALHDVATDRPHVTFTVDGVAHRLDADVIAGCDGSFGPSRAAVPETVRRVWEKTYPYSWLGVLVDVAPSTDAKGLNLAIADVSLLAPALTALIKKHDPTLTDAYSEAALQRVWRCTHFSWWMTSMLHISGDPFDAELQRSQLRWVFNSRAAAMGLAENYAGLPLTVG